MIPTIFEHLISCRSCNSAVLVEDPSATRSSVAAVPVAGDLVGLVIRHGTRDNPRTLSWLHVFPFGAADTQAQWGTEESSLVSRQIIYMEDCQTPESRRQISREWGLKWLDFEQHFETIAAWSGGKVGECPCKCHHWDNSVEERLSIDTTLAVVGQESGRSHKEPIGPETERGTHCPTDGPNELRVRAQSEEIPQTDLDILCWREQCQRSSN